MRVRRYEVITQLDTGEPGKPATLETEIVNAYTARDAITQVTLACRRRGQARYLYPGQVILNPGDSLYVVPRVVAVRPAPSPEGTS